jgi:N-acyl-phosphatidylethanolamine-hydrolysing phospholipase D
MARCCRLLALALVLGTAASCARVGGPVPGAPAHHREGGFANGEPGHPLASGWARTRFLLARILSSTFAPRSLTLPRADNDGAALRANRGDATVTWVGHATLLVQLDGVNILTDPNWSERASPLTFAGPRRYSAPGLRFEDLPPIHAVVVSHDHYDHLDVATVERLAREHRPRFLVPLGMKAWFDELGIEGVEELDWWDSRTLRALTFTSVPAQHFSGRGLLDRNRRLWTGWAVSGSKRFYFSGDTAHAAVFKEVGARLGPFDIAMVPIGAYLPPEIMKPVHTSPEEALTLTDDVRGRVLVAMHWGTFDLADEPLDEPPQRLLAKARERGFDLDRIWILRHGETRAW